jgi:hypothetical protein
MERTPVQAGGADVWVRREFALRWPFPASGWEARDRTRGRERGPSTQKRPRLGRAIALGKRCCARGRRMGERAKGSPVRTRKRSGELVDFAERPAISFGS